MTEEHWFSYPIWYTVVKYEHHDELLKYCLLRKSYDDGTTISNRGGWQSLSLNSDSDENTKKFSEFIKINVKPVEEKIQQKLSLINLWVNINPYGSYNTTHTHPNSYFSGVFYVKGDMNQGDICFENPLKYFNQFSYGDNNYLDREVRYKPETGKLLFFPSGLPHRVLRNETNRDRISIAFNMKLSYE